MMKVSKSDSSASVSSGRSYSFLKKSSDLTIEKIFSLVVSRFINIFVVCSLVGLVFSTASYVQSGGHPNHLVQLLVIGVIFVLFLLRGRLSKRILSMSLLSGVFFSGAVGVLSLGLAGTPGVLALVAFSLFTGMIYGRGLGIVASGLSLVVFAVAGFGAVWGYFPLYSWDTQQYLTAPHTWMSALAAFATIVTALLFCISAIQERLIEITHDTRAEHRFTAAVLDSQQDGFVIFDLQERKPIRWNNAVNAVTGYSDEEIVSLTIPEGWTDEVGPEEATALIAALIDGTMTSYEASIQTKRGEKVPIEIRASLFRPQPGAPELIMFTARDLRERKAAEQALREREEQLRQSEKMQAIGELAGGVAHDFNNQLTAIMGCTDLLVAEAKKGQFSLKYLEQLRRSTEIASKLTRRLLTFARRDDYESMPMDVHRIVEEVGSMLERSIDRNIDISVVCGARHPIVIGDSAQLQSAVLNLCLNARDAMPDGGQLTISTADTVRTGQEGNPVEGPLPTGRFLSISVGDTGEGMSVETRRRMFEPFFTTKPEGKGTGMGLATVFGYVQSQWGDIDVSSSPGRGTTVTINLPSAYNLTYRSQPFVLPSRRSEGRVLLVDDEDSVCRLISDVLENMGYTVQRCRDGKEAVDRYRQSWADIDVVILDMLMPRLNGEETFSALRRINHDIKVLVATGLQKNEHVASLLELGAKGYLQKPFTANELAEKIVEVLEA